MGGYVEQVPAAKQNPTVTAASIQRQGPSGPRAEGKRRAITRAALATFLANGFDASVDQIAAAAGASKVTVYNHFDSKEDLFRAVVHAELDAVLAAARERVVTRLGETNDVEAELVAICEAWVAGLASEQMIALRNLVSGEVRRFPGLGEMWWERGPGRLHEVLGDALKELVRRGLLAIPDVEVAVLQLSGLVLSPHQVYGAYGRPIAPELSSRLIKAGVEMFLRYYR